MNWRKAGRRAPKALEPEMKGVYECRTVSIVRPYHAAAREGATGRTLTRRSALADSESSCKLFSSLDPDAEPFSILHPLSSRTLEACGATFTLRIRVRFGAGGSLWIRQARTSGTSRCSARPAA